MNGVTGRMGSNQHLRRSILEIRNQGGVRVSDSEWLFREPILVGRDAAKLENLARATGVEHWTIDLDRALDDPFNLIYFDAQSTHLRVESVSRAIQAGKHVYCEKPVAMTTQEACCLYREAEQASVKHGVVQDKLWLPGLRKLQSLSETGFFGRVLSIRGEFGYWVFDGAAVPAQRPSWNYRKEDGGGIIRDMFCHWRYVLDSLTPGIDEVCCLGARHLTERFDERGTRYPCTADDAAYAIFQLKRGIVAQSNSSWTVRVRRDDLLTLQIDGTQGSAVAGLRDCWLQPSGATPRPVWNPDLTERHDYRGDWLRVPDQLVHDNAFKAQWELFLKHVLCGDEFPWNLLEGAKGVQLAEKGLESWETHSWVEVPELTAQHAGSLEWQGGRAK